MTVKILIIGFIHAILMGVKCIKFHPQDTFSNPNIDIYALNI